MPPVFATGERRRHGSIGLLLCLAAEDGRNAVRVNGNKADGALALQRSKPFDHTAGRQAKAWRARGFDRDQVAIFGIGGGAGGYRQLLSEHLFVDRLQPAASVRNLPENTQYAMLGMIDDLDDAAAVPDPVLFFRLINTEQNTVADAGGFAVTHFAWNMDADFGWRTVCVLIPFVGRGDEIAIAVASCHVGQNRGGQGARVMQFLPALLDGAFIGQFAQQAL